jgi:hypothetical protein
LTEALADVIVPPRSAASFSLPVALEVWMSSRLWTLVVASVLLVGSSGCAGRYCPFCRPGTFCPIHHTYTYTEEEYHDRFVLKRADEEPQPTPGVEIVVPVDPGSVGQPLPAGPALPISQNVVPRTPSEEQDAGTQASPFFPRRAHKPAGPETKGPSESDAGPMVRHVDDRRPAEPPSEPLVKALQCVLENRHADALKYLPADPPTQELFLRLLPSIAVLAHKSLDQLSPAEVAVLHDQLQGLMLSLRPRTELQIGDMCFCESVKSYGVYKPLPGDHAFQAGGAGQPGELVQLYVELHNFASQQRDTFYETRLVSSVEITDAAGNVCYFYRFGDRQQCLRSRSRLMDTFSNYSFPVPPHLPAGTYTLTLRVSDQTLPEQHREARKSVPFRVCAR